MDKELQEKVDKLVKSLEKSVKRVTKKNAIQDVLDSNSTAEMSPDSVAPDKTSAVKKSKDEEECHCEDPKACECDQAPEEKSGMHKSEEVVRNLMDNFKIISEMYLKKSEAFGDVYDKNQAEQAKQKQADKQGEARMPTEKEKLQIDNQKSKNQQKKQLWDKWNKQSQKFKDHQEKISGQNDQDMGDQKMAASEDGN